MKDWMKIGLGAIVVSRLMGGKSRYGNPQMRCPLATQDLMVNTENRNDAIANPKIQYGPLNLKDTNYWVRMAKAWNKHKKGRITEQDVENAMHSRCSNCVAFDISPRMDACMPGVTSDDDGRLGYCWMHHFKCHSARSCRTWAKGGPIKEDSVSYEWQERSNLGDS